MTVLYDFAEQLTPDVLLLCKLPVITNAQESCKYLQNSSVKTAHTIKYNNVLEIIC